MDIQLKGIHNFVCRGTSLEVRSGELLVLLGSNGAGKTTLLNVIAGLIAYEGSVSFEGTPVDAPWPGRRFAVLRRFDNARTVQSVKPANPVRQTRAAAVLVRISNPNPWPTPAASSPTRSFMPTRVCRWVST